MENNLFMSINDLIYAPLNAIKEADIALSNGILRQIATFSEPDDESTDIPIMKLKNIKFLYEKVKPDETGDVIETVGLTVPAASIVPLSALQIKSSVVKFNIEVKLDCDDSSDITLKGKTAPKRFRKSDYLPKMYFKMETDAATLPEGIARIIDVLDVNQVPSVEDKKYIDSDGIPYKNQEIYLAKHKLMEEIKNINSILDKINVPLSNLNRKLNSSQELSVSEINDLNTQISELNNHLEKYTDIKKDKEKELLLAEMNILEDKIGNGE